MSRICNVCAEAFNKTTRRLIKCDCNFECCRSCAKIYLLTLHQDPKCMSCNKIWDRKFMTNNFENSWISKTYKVHRESILFQKEQALFPDTQVHVERIIETEKLNSEISQLIQLKHEIDYKISKIRDSIRELNETSVGITKKMFVRACPKNNCKGFLNEKMTCGICETIACKDCREIKSSNNHECDTNILASVKLMERDSKPCPKCSAMIIKVIGCTHMFCTECKTSFDWKTLSIIPDRVNTNPHFMEYMRAQNGGESSSNSQYQVRCGREIDGYFMRDFSNKLRNNKNVKKELVRQLCHEIELTNHINRVELRRFNTDRISGNLDLRIDFMRNKIDQETFKKNIQKREKCMEKEFEIYNILNMYQSCSTDLVYRIHDAPENASKILKEISELKIYANDAFDEISNIYKCKKYEITNIFN